MSAQNGSTSNNRIDGIKLNVSHITESHIQNVFKPNNKFLYSMVIDWYGYVMTKQWKPMIFLLFSKHFMSGLWIYEFLVNILFIIQSIYNQQLWMRVGIPLLSSSGAYVYVCLMMTSYSIQFSNQNFSTKCTAHPLTPNDMQHILLGIMIESKMLLWWRIMIYWYARKLVKLLCRIICIRFSSKTLSDSYVDGYKCIIHIVVGNAIFGKNNGKDLNIFSIRNTKNVSNSKQ